MIKIEMTKRQAQFYKTLYRKLKIMQHKPH